MQQKWRMQYFRLRNNTEYDIKIHEYRSRFSVASTVIELLIEIPGKYKKLEW